MILVLNTNTNLCRIYSYNKHPLELTVLKEISHPENKLRISDLTADRPGHYQARDKARAAYSPRHDAKEVEIDNFSREIARELNQVRNGNGYNELIVIAPPRMVGYLYQHINKHVKNMVVNKIEKELINLPERELLQFLQENAKFRDQV